MKKLEIDANEFAERRQRVLAAIHPGVLVVASTPTAVRNATNEHPYRADSDLYYLTGFAEPDCLLVLSSVNEPHYSLFVRDRNPEREAWDGPRAGPEGARNDYGADAAHPWKDLDEKLPELLTNVRRLYYRVGRNRGTDDRIFAAIDRVKAKAKNRVWWPTELFDPSVILQELRLRKTDAELALMQRAIDISAAAHCRAMASARPGMFEYEVEASLFQSFRAQGAGRLAYETIVASGPNATVLHHIKNDRQIQPGDLVLVDAGCEYDYYASDITRTFPIDGKFSSAQERVYELVLSAQLEAIAEVRAGATLDRVHHAALGVLVRGLIELGVLEGDVEEIIEKKLHEPFYMHRTSHFLGMDVHDVGWSYVEGRPRELEAGMVITVEPGLYLRNDPKIPEPYRGIGVRIEDDVWVTQDGSVVLSAAVPKAVGELARLVGG